MAESAAVRPARVRLAVGVAVAAALAVGLLLWAKWWPYAAKVPGLAASGAWPGSDILRVGGVEAGDAPSWGAATSFTRAYGEAVWRALLAALLISAALQTLVPRSWLLRVLNRRGVLRSALAGGLAGTPSMMCTCCTAPVAVGLRRSGVSTAAVVAYWLGNPLLNPAVLVFLLLVAPWQWTVTRLVVGVLVVVGGAALVARLAEGRRPAGPAVTAGVADEPPSVRRYAAVLLRMSLVLVPEYLVVVMLIGAFRGWLLPLGPGLGSGVLVVVVAAVLGTALVVPTAGEIPVAQGLALAGLSLGGAGALLLTLPAVSVPGMVMVGRAFGWRVTLATAGVAVAGGLLAAVLLTLLGS
ncbi:permease [Actinoplanes sp. N902-109]|uniref:permease n=1 Tax=Actinoplanes sp. (strain N902-109) TaxID=649831 RepID=UPI0003294C06|nr:permease [Actinoplanes sp. N902-109]AGL16825.1 membrane protein, YraQ- like protein [Actinoplanes sp. N902-109]